MKAFLMTALLAVSLPGFTLPEQEAKKIFMAPLASEKNTMVEQYTNLQDVFTDTGLLVRTRDYPTQIVRLHGELKDSNRYCDEIQKEINEFFVKKIPADKFLYNTLTFCGFDPETEIATNFTINSYFDPISDSAIDYLQVYLAEHNGRPLLGIPFEIEEATGVVVSLNIDAGKKSDRDVTTMLRYQHDNASHYFPSNYDLTKELITDIRERFFSHEPKIVMPFMQKWFFPSADVVYYYVLKSSNYAEMRPERIFLMNKEPKVYTSPLRMYFGHHCTKYDNKHCL